MENYNGWANKATWNVALWINNTAHLYEQARGFMVDYKGKRPYLAFIEAYELTTSRTPDGFMFRSQNLNYAELNTMMGEL